MHKISDGEAGTCYIRHGEYVAELCRQSGRGVRTSSTEPVHGDAGFKLQSDDAVPAINEDVPMSRKIYLLES